MFNIGPFELMVILIVALLVVGPKRLPEVGRSIGRGLREFRKAQDEVKETLRFSLEDEPPPRATQAAAPTEAPASEPPAGVAPGSDGTSETSEVARTLGRGLAELRRAREEVQRTFRVDLSDLPDTPSRSRPATAGPDAEDPATAEAAPPAEAG
jgi:TatA/E family protein of Tat protein translocase